MISATMPPPMTRSTTSSHGFPLVRGADPPSRRGDRPSPFDDEPDSARSSSRSRWDADMSVTVASPPAAFEFQTKDHEVSAAYVPNFANVRALRSGVV